MRIFSPGSVIVMEKTSLKPIEVMCVTAIGGVSGISGAWSELEARLPSLKKRKFYGTFHYPDGLYRACVVIQRDESPEQMGLERWTIPGGSYVQTKLINWQENPERISEVFGEMAQAHASDTTRPSIEFYRRQNELILYLPIQEDDSRDEQPSEA